MTTQTKTYSLKGGDIQKDWQVIDAADQTLGRLASDVAILLMGKHKPTYSPHLDMGDFVIVVRRSSLCSKRRCSWKSSFSTARLRLPLPNLGWRRSA